MLLLAFQMHLEPLLPEVNNTFPFKKLDGTYMMNGKQCYAWEFINHCDNLVVDPACKDYHKPFKGTYRLYADVETGLPVRFTEVGRNVIFIGSHVGGTVLPLIGYHGV